MPNPKIYSKFEVRSDYDEKTALTENIEDIRCYLERELQCIDSIENNVFKSICMFAMIDCLAQEEANYSGGSKQVFCQFVLKHQKHYDFLENVEPVTLYYHIEDLIENVEIYPGAITEKIITLDSFGYSYGMAVNNHKVEDKAKEILEYLEKRYGKVFADKKRQEHRLVTLLYRMRSKAVHEMSGLGEVWKNEEDVLPSIPYYRDVGRGYVLEGNWVHDDVIELVIPNSFIRSVLVDCINGYLSECRDNMRFPFSNNQFIRFSNLSWYDK